MVNAESQAHTLGAGNIGFEIPAINTIVVDYLMSGAIGLKDSWVPSCPTSLLENSRITSYRVPFLSVNRV